MQKCLREGAEFARELHYHICPYRGQGSNSGWGSGGQFINRGRVQIVARSRIVAGFTAINTECLSIDAFVLLSSCKSLVTFTVAKDHQSCKSDV